MFSVKNRLKKRKSFNYIFAKGKNIRGTFVNVVFVETKSRDYKIGFSVNKKVGNAVVRNKAKRRMKEAFRAIEEKIKSNFNFILVAKPDISSANYEDIKKDIYECFNRGDFFEKEINNV